MLNAEEISSLIENKIKHLPNIEGQKTEGQIIGIADDIVKIDGLENAFYGEQILFEDGSLGIILNLETDSVGAIVLGDTSNISQGQKVKLCHDVLKVPVGKELIGRIVNPLGEAIDCGVKIDTTNKAPIEKVAPGVVWRKSVSQPLQTGIKSIDSMVPIGRGQRELIIGDRQTGKTALAIDTIINQKDQNVICIYVAIGQKASSIACLVAKLKEHGAMQHTIVVAATAADCAALQYIAPYAGCTMGEYFRDHGQDALIIYDDLTKHAWAYRQISLLLKRPPGREAYPGDVFYLHSKLLERSARVNEEYVLQQTQGSIQNKTGSLTALPIIETQSSDVSAFIATNVISITDGQIFLDTNLFNAGVRPAINAGLSVSRVGGAAQSKLIKQLAKGIRLMLAQYRELSSFAQFASDLDKATSAQLERGQRITELIKQKQYKPLPVGLISISLFAVSSGILDDIPIKDVVSFEEQLHDYVKLNHQSLLLNLNNNNTDLGEELTNQISSIILDFKELYLKKASFKQQQD